MMLEDGKAIVKMRINSTPLNRTVVEGVKK